jgi:gamma-glutamylcyclotransferase (GGCT)/AIG2-like uncharacterized protein YtfP
VRGYRLYHSGFPVAAAYEGDTIKGELWDIGDISEQDTIVTLNRLDGLEGFRGNDNPSSMYFRHTVTAHTDEGQVSADMYVGNEMFWRDFQGMKLERQDDTGIYYWDR